jgi:hypothetical protein
MGLRLYDSAWVTVAGLAEPLQVRKDRKNPAIFNVGDFQYDIDGRPTLVSVNAPVLTGLHSLQSAKEAGLRTDYNHNAAPRL